MTPQVISLSAAGSTAWIPVDYTQNPYYISLALVFSNTPNLTCKVEYTLDNVFDPLVTPTAFAHTSLTGITTNTTGSITYPIRAFRLTVTAWTSGTVTLTAIQGVTNPQIYNSQGSGGPLIYRYPDWPENTGCLLGSLVAFSTAARTSNVVTVTATGHGITTGATYVGFRFYYPGSPSLTAGWYDSILTIPDANTITFSAPGADFGSESINGGAAWTTLTTILTLTILGNTLRDGSKLTLCSFRTSDNTATTKTVSAAFGSSQFAFLSQTVNPNQEARFILRAVGTNKQFGVLAAGEGSASTTLATLTKDTTTDQDITLRGTLSAASAFLVLYGAHVEIIQ